MRKMKSSLTRGPWLALVAPCLLVALTLMAAAPAEGFSVGGARRLHHRGAFASSTGARCKVGASTTLLFSSPKETDEERERRLARLGYTDEEIRRDKKKNSSSSSPNDDLSVKVEEFEIDALTLTAVGFGLIAFNFFVLGNAGDGGLGGVVAKIINLSNQ